LAGRLGLDGLFVWERGINDDSVEVAGLKGSSADLSELGVFILD
jgi:hypothetical protein